MNGSLLPDKKFDLSSKSLGLQSIDSEKLISYKLFHIDKLANRQQSIKKYDPEQQKTVLSYFQNRGLLAAMPKLQKQPKSFISMKASLTDSNSHLPPTHQNIKTPLKIMHRKDRLLTFSNKRFSTECTYNEESADSIEKHQNELMDQTKQRKTLESGVAVRVRRKRKVTINQFLDERNKKVRDYECSKLCRTDIIPRYLLFSQKATKSKQKKLIKNISERLCPTYKICPNFDALQR